VARATVEARARAATRGIVFALPDVAGARRSGSGARVGAAGNWTGRSSAPGEAHPCGRRLAGDATQGRRREEAAGPSPPGDTKQKGTLSSVAKWCAGASAAAHLACAGAPSVRPGPSPEACPAGAVETMEALGISIGDNVSVYFPHTGQHHPVPVREGFTSVETSKTWGKLKGGTLLQGRLYFGEGRIYGRFTEARTPTGDSYTVCLEMWQQSKRGARFERDSTADNPLVFSLVDAQAVDRFE
jgi:hypothetical protein